MASKIKFDMPDFSLALKNATEKAIEEAGFAIVAEVVQSAPKKETTYVKQVQYIKEQKQVIAAAPYSAVLEYGSRPHIIQPTGGKKALHFKNKNGDWVFAKIVHHPGTKPLAIMRNAALKVQKEIGGTFTRHFKKELKKNV